MKHTFILLLLIFISSCASVKPRPYRELSHSDIVSSNSKYSIDIPENWFAYYEYHKILAYAPRKLKREIGQKKTNVFYAVYTDASTTNNLDTALGYYLKRKHHLYYNFAYQTMEAMHKEYGRYYIIKYKLKKSKGNQTVITALIVKDNIEYRLHYSALDEYFEEYLPDVIKTIDSFKIKE